MVVSAIPLISTNAEAYTDPVWADTTHDDWQSFYPEHDGVIDQTVTTSNRKTETLQDSSTVCGIGATTITGNIAEMSRSTDYDTYVIDTVVTADSRAGIGYSVVGPDTISSRLGSYDFDTDTTLNSLTHEDLSQEDGAFVDVVDASGNPSLIHYYGYWFSRLWICTNGFVSFDSNANPNDPEWVGLNPAAIPNPSNPNYLVAPLWRDLDFDSTGGGKIVFGPAFIYPDWYFVIGWVGMVDGNSQPQTFAVYFPVGNDVDHLWTVSFVYRDYSPFAGTVIGIEDPAGASGFSIDSSKVGSYDQEIWDFVPSFSNQYRVKKIEIYLAKNQDDWATSAQITGSYLSQPGGINIDTYATDQNDDTDYAIWSLESSLGIVSTGYGTLVLCGFMTACPVFDGIVIGYTVFTVTKDICEKLSPAPELLPDPDRTLDSGEAYTYFGYGARDDAAGGYPWTSMFCPRIKWTVNHDFVDHSLMMWAKVTFADAAGNEHTLTTAEKGDSGILQYTVHGASDVDPMLPDTQSGVDWLGRSIPDGIPYRLSIAEDEEYTIKTSSYATETDYDIVGWNNKGLETDQYHVVPSSGALKVSGQFSYADSIGGDDYDPSRVAYLYAMYYPETVDPATVDYQGNLNEISAKVEVLSMAAGHWEGIWYEREVVIKNLDPGKHIVIGVGRTVDFEPNPDLRVSASWKQVTVEDAYAPSQPQTLTATGGDGVATLTWSAPIDDGGVDISSYNIYQRYGSDYFVIGSVDGNTHTFIKTGLMNGVTYDFKVAAVNEVGIGASTGVSVNVGYTPTEPQNLEAISGNLLVSLSWDDPLYNGGWPLTGYSIFRDGFPDFQPSDNNLLESVDDAIHTYADSEVANFGDYWYKVCAANSVGLGAPSDAVNCKPGAPTAPKNLMSASGDSTVTLTWQEPDSWGGFTRESYNVYQVVYSAGNSELVLLGSTDSYTCSFVHSSLTNGVNYYYIVKAENYMAEGIASDEVSATPATLPGEPQNLAAASASNQITLTWSAPSTDGGATITLYNVYRDSAVIATVLPPGTPGASVSYVDNSVTNGVWYSYSVSAVNSVGEGALAPEVSVCPGIPTAPLSLAAQTWKEDLSAWVTLSWQAPTSDGGLAIENYRIYKGTAPGGETYLASVASSQLTYIDTAVSSSCNYFYRVSAKNSLGEGALSNEATAIFVPYPLAPTNLKAEPGYSEVYLNWESPAYNGVWITGYKLYRGTSSGGETLYKTLSSTTISYTDNGVTRYTLYYYKVSATCSVGESPLSNEVSAKPGAPSAPKNLLAVPGLSQVALSWTQPDYGSPFTGYKVYRGTASGAEIYLTTLSGTTLAWTDTGLTNCLAYFYKVRAVNVYGEGLSSNEASATPGLPTAPLSLQAVPGLNQVTLSWSAPTYNGGSSLTYYWIYRATSSGQEIYITQILSSGTSYVDLGLTNSVGYYYYVRAVNSIGAGPPTAEISAVPGLPTAPLNPHASSLLVGQIKVSWSAPTYTGGSSITEYRILRGASSGSESYLISVAGSQLSYVDSGLGDGKTYFYKIAAANVVGQGPTSSETYARTWTIPGAPTDLKAVWLSGNLISLTWSPPSDDGGIPGWYNIYRGTSSMTESLLATSVLSASYVDTSGVAGTTYFYYVTAQNPIGEGVPSSEVSSIIQAVPSAPLNLRCASTSTTSIALSWSPPSSDGGSAVTGYKIFRGLSSGTETQITSVSGSTLTYTNSGLTFGTTYYYKVRATNSIGDGAYSNEAYTKAGTPSPPKNIAARPASQQITLTWSSPDYALGLGGFKIYRGTTSGGETLLATVAGSVYSYTDSGLTNAQKYYYKLSAENLIGEGPLTDELLALPGVPSCVQNVVATVGCNQIQLTWMAPQYDGGSAVTGYRVLRGTSPSAESLLATVGTTPTSYLDTTVADGVIYYYKVVATNAIGVGADSLEVSVRSSLPSAPQYLIGSYSTSGIRLGWTPPLDDGGYSIDEYRIYRGTEPGNGVLYATTEGDSLVFGDTSLPGAVYYYQISAVSIVGESGLSGEACILCGFAPSSLYWLQATAGPGMVTATWVPPISNGGFPVLNYNIYRGLTADAMTMIASTDAFTLAYVDAGLENGVTYFYSVTAENLVGEGLPSATCYAQPISAPSAPQGLSSASGIGEITLSWNPPADDGGYLISSYRIYRGVQPGSEVFLVSLDGAAVSHYDSGLTNGICYYYKVSAVNEVGEGVQSSVYDVPGAAPSAPLSFTAVSGTSYVTLSWSAPLSDGGCSIANYSICRSVNPGMETFFRSVGPGVLSYVDSEVTSGHTYYYTVKALNVVGPGPASAEAFDIVGLLPTAPLNLVGTPGIGEVVLTWSPPESDGGLPLLNYEIYRGTSAGAETFRASIIGTTTSFTDTSVTYGMTYFYKVCAVNAIGSGPFSNEISATVWNYPSAPQNLVATAGNTEVALSWSAPASNGGTTITSYNIYRDSAWLVSVPGTATSYVNSGLVNGVTYHYRVAAVNAVGEGTLSAEVSATPEAEPITAPTAPLSLTATAVSTSSVRLAWGYPANDGGELQGYKIYRSTKSNKEVYLATVVGDIRYCYDNTVSAGKTYYYKVSAFNSADESPLSNEAVVKVPRTTTAAVFSCASGAECAGPGYILGERVSTTLDKTTIAEDAVDHPSTVLGRLADEMWTPSVIWLIAMLYLACLVMQEIRSPSVRMQVARSASDSSC